MKCTGCGTHMYLDRAESTEIASTHWYRCPLCSKVRLTSALNRESVDHASKNLSNEETTQNISHSNAVVEPLHNVLE